MKLRTKFVLVLMAVLLVLVGANVYALTEYQRQIVGQERANVEETADLTGEQIQETIHVRKNALALAGQKYPASDLRRADTYFGSFVAESQHYYVGTVLHPNGTVAYAVGEAWTDDRRAELTGAGPNQTAANESTARYFRVARNGSVFVGEPQEGPYRTLVPVAAPVLGPDGREVVGVVQAAIEVDAISFFPMLQPLETSRQTVAVTTEEGTTLKAPAKRFDSTINASATVQPVGWTVTVSRDRSRLDQRLRDLAYLQALSLLVVFGSVIGFGYWEYSSNLRQTERLLSGFDRIKAGNYGHRLSLASAEEWRQISDGFNELARGLAFREAQLLEREQRLGVLNRVLRHNVRNEMSVILNYAQLIHETTTDDQAATAAHTIVDTGRKLTDLSEKARQIEEALDSADEGLVEQDLVDVVRESIDQLRTDGETAVVFDGPESLTVAAIPSLKAAVDNVVENAVEHNDADGARVEIAVGQVTRDGRDRVVLKIADNGPGIPEQEKNVLVQGRETALEHGSGLGLWLVYWVVDKSDGSLRFEENDPRGSIVTVELHAEVPDDVTPTQPIDAEGEGAEGEPELPGEEDAGAVAGDD